MITVLYKNARLDKYSGTLFVKSCSM